MYLYIHYGAAACYVPVVIACSAGVLVCGGGGAGGSENGKEG